MQIFVPRECTAETRTAITPETAKKLIRLGFDLYVEAGVGQASFYADEAYQDLGVHLVNSEERASHLKSADLILHVLPLPEEELSLLKKKTWHISFCDPFKYAGWLALAQEKRLNIVSLERIPRLSMAQKMDALSSQSSLAGYAAVLEGAHVLRTILPMMVTPAGTLQAARVFVIGAGVAGLQAIATAKRLGARVEAFDTRPEVEEQVQSLGAKFVKIDLGETGSTKQGYAKALTPEQLQLQKQGLLKTCARADLVITTAKVFGRKAPIILDKNMVEAMRPGSVIVDLAAESGGNTEGLVIGQNITTHNGISIIGEGFLERHVATAASQMLASNFYALLEYAWDAQQKTWKGSTEDPILSACHIVREGESFYN